MKAQLIAAGFAMLAFGAVAPAAMAEGPRAASSNNWAGMSAPAMAPQAAVAPSPASEGPRASSGTNWAGMSAPTVAPQAAVAPSPASEGPRASSGTSWPGMVAPGPQLAAAPQNTGAAPAAQYQWVEGYDKGGRWQGKWQAVR